MLTQLQIIWQLSLEALCFFYGLEWLSLAELFFSYLLYTSLFKPLLWMSPSFHRAFLHLSSRLADPSLTGRKVIRIFFSIYVCLALVTNLVSVTLTRRLQEWVQSTPVP